MDPAICGYCRCDYCRCGVYRDDWDQLLKTFKNVPAQTKGGVDPFIVGHFRVGHFRVGVTIPFFDEMLEQFKKAV